MRNRIELSPEAEIKLLGILNSDVERRIVIMEEEIAERLKANTLWNNIANIANCAGFVVSVLMMVVIVKVLTLI